MAAEPLSIDERRRRRDQRLAVQAAEELVQEAASQARTITLEWAAAAALLAAGLGLLLAVWYRHLGLPLLGAGAWMGVAFGALLTHGALQAERRLIHIGVCLFAAIPL